MCEFSPRCPVCSTARLCLEILICVGISIKSTTVSKPRAEGSQRYSSIAAKICPGGTGCAPCVGGGSTTNLKTSLSQCALGFQGPWHIQRKRKHVTYRPGFFAMSIHRSYPPLGNCRTKSTLFFPLPPPTPQKNISI